MRNMRVFYSGGAGDNNGNFICRLIPSRTTKWSHAKRAHQWGTASQICRRVQYGGCRAPHSPANEGPGSGECRAPKVLAGKMADCIQTSDTTGGLQGICPDCNKMIYRRIDPQKLAAVRGDLEVTVTQARPRLGQRAGTLRKSCEPAPLTGQRGSWLRVSFPYRLPAVRWDDSLNQIPAASWGLS
jgi:hypothetical protein